MAGAPVTKLGSDFVEKTASARTRRMRLSEFGVATSPKQLHRRRGSMASVLSSLSSMSAGSYARTRTHSLVYVACGAAWVVAASALLLVLDLIYRFSSVDEVRERYVAASVEDVGIQAAVVLSAALAARDALDYAVQRKLYFEPLDYAAVRAALEPVLVAAPALRSVDLAFSDRNESLLVQVLGSGVLLVQSDAEDCARVLGPRGCLAGALAREQAWYALGQQLAADGEGSFRWMEAPGFVPSPRGSRGGAQASWAPAYSLVFRSSFPGTGGQLWLTGRATLDISSLRSGGRLGDAALLGLGGAAFICDSGGALLAAMEPGRVAVGRSPGRAHFRRAWELDFPWAKHLEIQDFARGAVRDAEGFRVVVAPLRGRGLGHFSALMAASREPFAHGPLKQLCTMANAFVGLPYAVGLATFLVLREYHACKRRRELRRVGPDDSGSDFLSGLSGRSTWLGDPLGLLRNRTIKLQSYADPKKRGFQTQLELKASGVTR